MAVTLRDIAASANLSQPTVSRVLNNTHKEVGISDESAEKIRAIAKQLGYRPNMAARSIANGIFRNVVLVQGTREKTSDLPGLLQGAIHDALAKSEYHLTLSRLSDSQLTDSTYIPNFLRHWMCDGVLMNYHAGTPQRLLELVSDSGLPLIWTNFKGASDSVYFDDFGAAENLTGRLIQMGHRRIAYADRAYAGSAAQGIRHYSKEDRMSGYVEAMKNAGLKPQVLVDQAGQPEMIAPAVHAAFASADRPTAVIGYAQHEVLPIEHIASLHGLRVPVDLSLAMFGQDDVFSLAELKLSMAVTPFDLMGVEAVRTLFKKIKLPKKAIPSVAVPLNIEMGQTMAAPRGK